MPLSAMRAEEGMAVTKLLHGQVEKIAELLAAIEKNDARKPEAIGKQLELQVARLMEAGDSFDPQATSSRSRSSCG